VTVNGDERRITADYRAFSFWSLGEDALTAPPFRQILARIETDRRST
jgi:hypothetical protein